MDLHDKLKGLLYPKHTDIGVRLKEQSCSWDAQGVDVSGTFYYLTFANGKPTLDEFVEYVYRFLPPFCLPRARRKEALDAAYANDDWGILQDILDEAKGLFIKAKDAQVSSGEPGELILYILLESVMQAPLVACKMYLKTSANMNVHGSDGIHFRVSDGSSQLELFWGESKVDADLPGSLDRIFGSVADFLADEKGVIKRTRDINIIKEHIDVPDSALREALIAYFQPWLPQSNSKIETFACLSVFEYDGYLRSSSGDPLKAEERFLQFYEARVKTACELIIKKLDQRKMKHLRFQIFLLPVPDLSELRTRFYQHIEGKL